MKIRIITEREIKADEFWGWADAQRRLNNEMVGREQHALMMHGIFKKLSMLSREDFDKLHETGRMEFTDNLEHTKATTTYEIVETESNIDKA